VYERFEHIGLRGFCAAVPENLETMAGLMEKADEPTRFTLKRVAALAGLKQRHVAPTNMFTGDLALAAGRELLRHLDWDPASLDMLFFVTQTPDFLSPPTGYLIAAGLGCSKSCAVMDITSGCPGMLHGAWLASGHLKDSNRRALILSGDASSKVLLSGNIGNVVLMGDAVGALALEYDTAASALSFNLASQPDTAFSLVNYDSGYRPTPGKPEGMVMDGNKITEFCLAAAPACMKEHLEREGLTFDDMQALYLHQPNKMILDTLRRRLDMDTKKIPQIFADYANCSSASLALSVCSHAGEFAPGKALFCAFGSGLAVASMLGELDPAVCFPIVRVTQPELLRGDV
jgi:3-oxoacyl-[acyl-carrier-protein] synthase-3